MFEIARISSCRVGRTDGDQHLMRPSTIDGRRTMCIAGPTALSVDRKWRLREVNSTSSWYLSHLSRRRRI